MMHSNQGLYDMLNRQLIEINKQMDAITARIFAQLPEDVKPGDDTVYDWVDMNGKPMLSDMLVAKSQVLAAMANLRLEATMNRTGGPGKGKW